MRTSGRLTTALLTCATFSLCTLTGHGQFNYIANNGTITIVGYTGPGAEVVLPEFISGLPVTGISSYAFFGSSTVTRITVPDSVTNIGTRAFGSCSRLATVKLPSTLVNIAEELFLDCGSLATMAIPEGATDIGFGAFIGCHSLTNLSLPTTLTDIADGAFRDCTKLTSVLIPEGVTNIGFNAFLNCNKLTSVTLPNALTRIASGTFAGCAGLTSITIPSSVRNIEGGDFLGPGKTGAFSNCGSLTNVLIPEGVANIGFRAFSGCTSLKSIAIPDSVTCVDYGAFSGCTSVATITVSENNSFYTTVDGVLFNKDQTTLMQYPAGKIGTYILPGSVADVAHYAFSGCTGLTAVALNDGVTNIGYGAFSDCCNLTSVNVPDSVTIISTIAFFGCSSLTNIEIPASVVSLGDSVFYGCTNLAAVMVDAENPSYSSMEGVLFNKDLTVLIKCPPAKALGSYTIPDTVISIDGYAFDGCLGLTSVNVPESTRNLDCVFGGCSRLTAIDVSPANSWYSSMEGVLFNKSQTELLRCPSGKTGSYRLPDGVNYVGPGAFSACANLTSVSIPSSVISVGPAFGGCSGLNAMNVDPGNPYWSSVGGVLFDANQSVLVQYPGGKVGTYVIPEGVTAIGYHGFNGCTGLTTVVIPKTVTNIHDFAFQGCNSLVGAYFEGNAPMLPWEDPYWVRHASAAFLSVDKAILYHLPDALGWGATFGGRPTSLWLPEIGTSDANFGVRTNQFGFNITWARGSTVVVEAATDPASGSWLPVRTNTLTEGFSYFSDNEWTDHPTRVYRLRWP